MTEEDYVYGAIRLDANDNGIEHNGNESKMKERTSISFKRNSFESFYRTRK